MHKIYTFHRPFVKYRNVHSLIRNVFQDECKDSKTFPKIAGFESQELYRVLSPIEPSSDEGLVGSIPIKEHLAKEESVITVDCIVSFSNRGREIPENRRKDYWEHLHKEGIVKSKDPKYPRKPLSEQKDYSDRYKVPKKLCANSALTKFMRMTGLREVNTAAVSYKEKPNAHFLGPMTMPDFVLYNRFAISGLYAVEDERLFLKCLREGVGSRRTYGYGIIFAEAANQVFSEDGYIEMEDSDFI